MISRTRTALVKARKWIATDLATFFDKDGERLEATQDFDLSEQTKLLDEIDEALKIEGEQMPSLHDGHLLESMSRLGTV